MRRAMICIDFYVYFPKTAQSTPLKALYNVPQFSKSCPKKYYTFCPVTSIRWQSRLYLREWDRGWKKRTFVLRKSLWFHADSTNWTRGFKKCQTMFFHANTIKNGQKRQTMTYMPNTIFSCQSTFKKANFVEFGL